MVMLLRCPHEGLTKEPSRNRSTITALVGFDWRQPLPWPRLEQTVGSDWKLTVTGMMAMTKETLMLSQIVLPPHEKRTGIGDTSHVH